MEKKKIKISCPLSWLKLRNLTSRQSLIYWRKKGIKDISFDSQLYYRQLAFFLIKAFCNKTLENFT